MTEDIHINISAPKSTTQEQTKNKKNDAENEMDKLEHGRRATAKIIKKEIKTKKDL